MLEIFYSLFESTETDWEIWNKNGFFLGFLSLILSTLLFCLLYNLVLGRGNNKKYASMGHWFLFMLFNSILTFLSTIGLCGFVAFENIEGLGGIAMDIWVFALWNSTLYAIIFYIIGSLIFNRFSVHHKFIPFKLF